MRHYSTLLYFLGTATIIHRAGAFVLPQQVGQTSGLHKSESLLRNSDSDDGSSESIPSDTDAGLPAPVYNAPNDELSSELKSKLYRLAASYDRGFAATPKARTEANEIIQQLKEINPTENAAKGIDGGYSDDDVPLKAIWRMIWTTAFDVVSLGASPIAAPSAIYQVITDPPIATNIIDFIPRAQTFFPSSSVPSSLLRAEVTTRASSRNGAANRVGLFFEGVKLQPIELLGQKVDNLPPLSVDLTWQQDLVDQVASFVPGLENFSSDGKDEVDAPGYFDVEYLDDELLIICQQAPGGRFALVKVDNCDP